MAEEDKKAPEKKVLEGAFKEGLLSEEKLATHHFVKERIEQLQDVRKDHYGKDIDTLWSDADKDYVPHRLGTAGSKIIATDEDRGWRGALVRLGSENWQSDVSAANPYIKIQAALAILVDQNPSGVFTATQKKFQAASLLMKELHQRSWQVAKSLYQLKLFVFNLAKYGWAIARTYPLRLENEVQELVEFDPENPAKSKYEKKTVVEYNDVYRENIDPRNAWIDDMAKPNNEKSLRDWSWRKIYDYEGAKREFGKYPMWKYVPTSGGNVGETVATTGQAEKKLKGRNLVEVYFYENRVRDIFYVSVAGVPVVIEPLPIADRRGVKKLSVWQTYWTLRHAESPIGIGIYEAIRYDQGLLDRISNMTIDQITLAIYKMFFYQGTQNLQETGQITITPGVGKQVIDPKSITWLDVPGPDRSALEMIQLLQKRVDENSGVTEALVGTITGKTAFEIAQAKEAALKRLKIPFDNVLESLENEGYITLSLFQLLYSIPEVYTISDPRLIDDYLKEIKGDEDLYQRSEAKDEQGNVTGSEFEAKVYPEFPLNLDQDEKGNLVEKPDAQFFRIKPKMLEWEGIITIKGESILSPSKQIDKALSLEFYNLFIPLLSTLAQERVLATQVGESKHIDELPHGKAAKELAQLYDKDPRDVFPASWFEQEEEQTQPAGEASGDSMFIDSAAGALPKGPTTAPADQMQPAVQPPQANPTLPAQPQGLAQRIISRITQPFRQT